MDNITVDLGPGEREPVAPGADAVLIGPGLPAEEMAGRLSTLNYEVTCGISARVPREHHRGGLAGSRPAITPKALRLLRGVRRGARVTAAPLEAARAALAGRAAWVVGGAVRDGLLERDTDDVDLVVEGDPRPAAQALARATRAAHFELSGAFGAWRVVGPGQGWHVDLVPLREGGIEADLAARDFTVNAMAEPLAGGALLDPHGGREDLAARRLRMVSPRAMADDPLRTLRAVRFTVELGLEPDAATAAAVAGHAAEIARIAPERVFAELKRVVSAPRVRDGLALMLETGLTEAVLPELAALRGVEQNVFHHADVYDHTLEVLDAVVAIEADPVAAGLGPETGGAARRAARRRADPRAGDALRRAAARRRQAADARLPARRPRDVHRPRQPGSRARPAPCCGACAPPSGSPTTSPRSPATTCASASSSTSARCRAARPGATCATTSPYAADVTILTVADRFATRGRNAEPAIAAHLELAREMLAHALAERAAGPRAPLIRGDELARELGLRPGPRLGELLAAVEEARYAGEIATREDALRLARQLV